MTRETAETEVREDQNRNSRNASGVHALQILSENFAERTNLRVAVFD